MLSVARTHGTFRLERTTPPLRQNRFTGETTSSNRTALIVDFDERSATDNSSFLTKCGDSSSSITTRSAPSRITESNRECRVHAAAERGLCCVVRPRRARVDAGDRSGTVDNLCVACQLCGTAVIDPCCRSRYHKSSYSRSRPLRVGQ